MTLLNEVGPLNSVRTLGRYLLQCQELKGQPDNIQINGDRVVGELLVVDPDAPTKETIKRAKSTVKWLNDTIQDIEDKQTSKKTQPDQQLVAKLIQNFPYANITSSTINYEPDTNNLTIGLGGIASESITLLPTDGTQPIKLEIKFPRDTIDQVIAYQNPATTPVELKVTMGVGSQAEKPIHFSSQDIVSYNLMDTIKNIRTRALKESAQN